MSLANPFKAMIAKGIDAGADGAKRAAKISNRSDRPVHYLYEFEIAGIAQVVKEEGNDLSLTLKPVLPEVVGTGAAGMVSTGMADGTFTYKMKVEFGLPRIGKNDEADDSDDGSK